MSALSKKMDVNSALHDHERALCVVRLKNGIAKLRGSIIPRLRLWKQSTFTLIL